MPPRRRIQSAVLPRGIRPDQVPAYVYWRPAGRGRWVIYIDGSPRRLAGPDATLAEIWRTVEELKAPDRKTFRWLSGEFQESPAWTALAESTRRDYRYCHEAICARKLRDGRLFGDILLVEWSSGAITRYLDARAKDSRSRANHELRYLKRVWRWAHNRDMVSADVARGVEQLPEQSRSRYVGDGEYAAFLDYAQSRGYAYVAVICELAYLCRLRLAEALDLRRVDIRDEGLYSARRKGSKDAVTAWSPRLRAAVDAALALHGRLSSIYLLPGKSGGRLLETTVQTAWQRLMRDFPGERWTLHDLKRKGVSDATGDKLTASGHRSPAMLKVYDVLPLKADPTK